MALPVYKKGTDTALVYKIEVPAYFAAGEQHGVPANGPLFKALAHPRQRRLVERGNGPEHMPELCRYFYVRNHIRQI